MINNWPGKLILIAVVQKWIECCLCKTWLHARLKKQIWD